MRKFQIWHALWMSFYSRPLYRDVAQKWTGLGLAYLCLLVAAAWLPPLLKFHVATRRWTGGEAQEIARQFPRITIQKGEVRVDPPGRHVINDPETGKPFLVIDTEATAEELAASDDTLILLTRHQLIVWQPQRGQMRVQDLRGIESFSLTPDELRSWLNFAGTFLALCLFPFVFVFSLVYRLVQVLVYGLLGRAMAAGAKLALGYDALVRLSAVAITPAVWLDTLHDFSPFKVPVLLWWLICFLVAMGYLQFGIVANRPAAAEGVPAPGTGGTW